MPPKPKTPLQPMPVNTARRTSFDKIYTDVNVRARYPAPFLADRAQTQQAKCMRKRLFDSMRARRARASGLTFRASVLPRQIRTARLHAAAPFPSHPCCTFAVPRKTA